MDSKKITVSQEHATTCGRSITAFSSIMDKLHEENYYFSKSSSFTVADVRDGILQLGAIVGGLCTVILSEQLVQVEMDDETKTGHYQFGRVFLQLFVVARVCGIDLRTSILKKVELNGRKYPVELCKVRTLDLYLLIRITLIATNS